MTFYIIIARMIQRYIYNVIRDRLAQFPAVVLLGARQVGKTTLAKQVAKGQKSIYLDLEDPKDRRKLSDPNQYLEAHVDKLVILDEVHRIPGLFQSLRGSIDRGGKEDSRRVDSCC